MGEANDLDHLTDFHQNVALVFFAFHTSLVSFSSLPELLLEFGCATLSERQHFLNANGPWDRADFYVGNRTSQDLPNVEHFFNHNGWITDRRWRYDAVVVVAYNNLSNIIVDVPSSSFPWCINYFGVSGLNILDQPLMEMVSSHTFLSACQLCYKGNRRCNIGRSGPCDRCGDKPCLPQFPKELDNLRAGFVSAIIREKVVLCPTFQFLLGSASTANGYDLYSSTDKAILKNIVEPDLATGRDFVKEAFVRQRSRAYQLVQFDHGRIKIIEEHEMGDRIGFSTPKKKVGKKALGYIIPNFGVASPIEAYSLMNSALGTPGEVFVADLMIWNTKLEATPSRIMMLAQFESISSVYIMAGWV